MKKWLGFQVWLALVCSICALPGMSAFGSDDGVDVQAISKSLTSVPVLELAPTAAKLVEQSNAKQLEATVQQVVRIAIKINQSATVPVVATVAGEKPEMASVAAGTAAVLVPKLAVDVAKTAANAAPAQARKIVQAVCEAAPKQYKEIAIAVANIVPSANKQILDAVATAVPELKTQLTQLESAYGDNISVASFETILQQAGNPGSQLVQRSQINFANPQTPIVNGPPFTPLPPTVTEEGPGSTEQSGGRNYSSP